jgi:hypothetical protein
MAKQRQSTDLEIVVVQVARAETHFVNLGAGATARPGPESDSERHGRVLVERTQAQQHRRRPAARY